MRATWMKVATVVCSGETEETSRAVVQDVKVDHGTVTRNKSGDRHNLERRFMKKWHIHGFFFVINIIEMTLIPGIVIVKQFICIS